ncbi:hypothetical protein AGMMS49546_02730 [Spirochaetia bacterium]|nr:hypothetical protein AGMMS49546_02730 [Spirochaetia bacterium]
MNILIDTNVALDALLERQPFYAAAGERLAVDYIVTRNPDDFSLSPIEAVTPDQFIRRITDLD